MDPLGFVEIVDRHRDVVVRHPVYRWPVRIGRGYQADVLIDDPFIAPLHIAVEPAGESRFRVSDLGSVNGFSLKASARRLDSAEVGPDDLVRLGHTQIRIRAPSYAVPKERPMQAAALYRRPAAFLVMALLTMGVLLWNAWIMTSDENEKYAMLFPIVGLITAGVIWISIWSFVSNVVGRSPNFFAHGFVACAGLIALLTLDAIFGYLSFGFDAGWVKYFDAIAVTALLAYIVYRHLLLNSRASRRSLAIAGTAISVVLCGSIYGLSLAVDLTQDGSQRYSESIKAPMFLFVSGTSTNTFMSDAEALKRKVDAMDKRD